MQNPMTAQVHFSEYQSNMAWINEHDWQIERPAKRHPVRQAVAKALITLANALTPTTQREAQTAS